MSHPQPAQSQPQASPPRRWSLDQEAMAREFMQAYGIEQKQISFDGNDLEPIFDFEALNLLAHTLGNFPMISTDFDKADEGTGLVIATCDITVPDGRVRHVSGASFIGETLPNFSTIQDYAQALNVAQARALRKALRAVGWDPVRAHSESKEGALPLNLQSETDTRIKDLAQAHILGKEAGLIQDGDKSLWSRIISMWFNGKTSSADLTDEELVIFIARLRGLRSSQPHGAGSLASNATAMK